MAFNNSTVANAPNKEGQNSDKCSIDGIMIYIVITAFVFIILVIGVALSWLKTYKSLKRTIRDLQEAQNITPPAPEAHLLKRNSSAIQVETVKMAQNCLLTSVVKRQHTRPSSGPLCRPPEVECHFNRADLNLHMIIKAGREGVYYKTKMMHSTIKGHNKFTCKISKKGCSRRKVEKEISIMQKLGTHKNLLQLLDWDLTETPYMLVMEYAAHGTLHNFLRVNQETLCRNNELQHHLTIAAYHIAHAMKHLHSRMILHCDLALRNIMVHKFPDEVKVAEFGLAREVTHTWSKRSNCSKDNKMVEGDEDDPTLHASRNTYPTVKYGGGSIMLGHSLYHQQGQHTLVLLVGFAMAGSWLVPSKQIPFRWYPPEYFKNDIYGFKGDVWAFGIVIWEMQTFGTLPYPDLNTSEEVARHVCAGHRNGEPEVCRPEMLQLMKDCWQDPCSLRPSFMDIVSVLENILEFDLDYVEMKIHALDQNASVVPEDSDQTFKMEHFDKR